MHKAERMRAGILGTIFGLELRTCMHKFEVR